MLMCANDVVISRRVQMERDINTDATGNEVWVHRHLCACVSEMHGGDAAMSYCVEHCREEGK